MTKPGARRPALPPILPSPVRAQRTPGAFSLSPAIPIVLVAEAEGPLVEATVATAQALQAEIVRLCGVTLPIERHANTRGLGAHIALRAGAAVPRSAPALCLENAEAYHLEVSKRGVKIRAPGAAGLRYGVESLQQLVDTRGRIPYCTVDDAPRFPMRGIMLDVSRGKVPTPESLRELVDLCVRLKLNVLMLYTEHTFRWRRHPEIGRDDSPLTAEEMLMLDAYAAARHVDLVPCLQSLGHMEDILKLSAYQHLAETDSRWSAAPAEPGTYDLLRDLYDEYLPNFRSGWLNANCDEPWDLGEGKSAARAEEIGKGALYLEHVERLRTLAAAHGKRTMIWGDVVHQHPSEIPNIDRDLVLLDWWYEAEFDFDRVRVFRENEIEFLVCPGTSTWNSLFPRIENSQTNIERWAEAGHRHGALGVLNTDWGDRGHYNLQGNSWFGYAMGAQHSWSSAIPDKEFDRAFSRALFDDASGEVARLYRALGAIHDPGFKMFNGSALQFLYFDEVERGYFIGATKPGALRRCEQQLLRVRSRIDAAADRFEPASLTHAELLYAADASILAVRKARAGAEYTAWRRNPERLDAAGRRRLSRTLSVVAAEQSRLAQTLRRLWLARSAVSNLDRTLRRLRRAQKSLRRAVKYIDRNHPTEAPPATKISGRDALRAIRESFED